MTRIAILETGVPPEALRDDYDDYPARFRALLGDGVPTTRFNVQEGRLPDDPSAFEGVVVTGSAAGVYEDHFWIPHLLDWLRTARGRTRMLGICFGHQAMAQAFGGHVEKSDKGWGVGLHRYDILGHEPWMFPKANSVGSAASSTTTTTAGTGSAISHSRETWVWRFLTSIRALCGRGWANRGPIRNVRSSS